MSTIFESEYSVTTIIGLLNEFESMTALQQTVLSKCTINAQHNVIPTVMPTKTPQLFYFGIGINGYYNVNQDTPPLSQPYMPAATDMDLYQPIPFRIVPITADLSPTERAQYRMRTMQTFNGTQYFCYWLKLINFTTKEVEVMQVNPTGGETPYVFNPKNLKPIPKKSSTGQIVNASGDTVIVSLSGTCPILGSEIVEVINIMYGDLRFANISELGFYTGQDVTAQGPDGKGGEISYTESAYTQLSSKLCSLPIPLSKSSKTYIETIEYVNSNVINV